MLVHYCRTGGPVHREGCGVPQNGTPPDIVHLHHRPPPASTGSCLSTVDLLQPPPMNVHPRAPVHPASTARSSTGYCSTSPLHGGPVQPPLHGLLFIKPSTGYCSTSPPPATVQLALHGVLFIHRLDQSGYCSSSSNGLYYHGFLFIQPPLGTVHPNPPTTLTIHPEAASIGFS